MNVDPISRFAPSDLPENTVIASPQSPPTSPKGFIFSLFNSINSYEKVKDKQPRDPIFKDIPGFEGRYEATVSGGIYSVKARKFLKPGDDTYGYDTVSLDKKSYKVHKLIALTFLENPEKHTQIDHINQNRKDNRVENLRYISNSDNQLNKKPRVKKPKEMKNILIKKSTFKVSIKSRSHPTVYKSFKTVDEAIAFRDATLNERKHPKPQVAL